jgi:hypothetical protein
VDPWRSRPPRTDTKRRATDRRAREGQERPSAASSGPPSPPEAPSTGADPSSLAGETWSIGANGAHAQETAGARARRRRTRPWDSRSRRAQRLRVGCVVRRRRAPSRERLTRRRPAGEGGGDGQPLRTERRRSPRRRVTTSAAEWPDGRRCPRRAATPPDRCNLPTFMANRRLARAPPRGHSSAPSEGDGPRRKIRLFQGF